MVERILLCWRAGCLAAATSLLFGCHTLNVEAGPLIEGVVWQPSNQMANPRGSWHQLGARRLLVQWQVVDKLSFVAGTELPLAPSMPDWGRIAREPWAEEVILGLAGRHDETAARADLANLAALAEKLIRLPTPLNVVGWYFPVEIDPTWDDAASLAPILERLPRPLWVSAYDSANIGAVPYAEWLASWLPQDVGILFQDGVGVHAREPKIALHYMEALSAKLGKARVRLIAEAFRPKQGGGFRSATVHELSQQLTLYKSWPVYLFDGPHYVSDRTVRALKKRQP